MRPLRAHALRWGGGLEGVAASLARAAFALCVSSSSTTTITAQTNAFLIFPGEITWCGMFPSPQASQRTKF